jgi:tetratricopeptide (TPR) repeat protein
MLLSAATALPAALLAAALTHFAQAPPVLSNTPPPKQWTTPLLSQANDALQAGQADKALALLKTLPSQLESVPDPTLSLAEAANLECRVRLTLEEWDAAVTHCEQAVRLQEQNAFYHLWLGRALGRKADKASFLTAFGLAKRTRSEFEESVRLDPGNAEALADLGDFYRQAPGVVGGGIDKAQAIASKLDKLDPASAHVLHGWIAEEQKDYANAEQELKQAIAAGKHPALQWATLAGFYSRRKRYSEMDSALHSVIGAAQRDQRGSVALYDGAGLLIEAKRDPAMAAKMLDDYLAGSQKTEDAPAFAAHVRLARLDSELGNPAAANRERAEALALANEFKPAHDYSSQ